MNEKEIGESGYLKISSEADRVAVANILFKNKYTVRPVRKKRNAKSYDYYVKYEMQSPDVFENGGL